MNVNRKKYYFYPLDIIQKKVHNLVTYIIERLKRKE